MRPEKFIRIVNKGLDEMKTITKTLKVRIRDKHAKLLNRMALAVGRMSNGEFAKLNFPKI